MRMKRVFQAGISVICLTAFILVASSAVSATKPARKAGQAKPVQSAQKKDIKARSVILLIGDGMGPVEVKAGSIFLYGGDKRMAIQKMPVQALVKTSSNDSEVTDSAAAASAMATGKKINNGMVSVAPDGTRRMTILELAHNAGKYTGLVATSTITHATPACFAAHVNSRGSEYEIARQMIGNKVNVLFGGGSNYFHAPVGLLFVNADVLGPKEAKILEVGEKVSVTYWVTIEKTFTAPAESINASVWAWRGDGEVNCYVDDLRLAEKGAKPGSNMLANPGFEGDGLKGWNDWSNTKLVPDGGSLAVEIGPKGGVEQKVALKPGQEYVISFRARTADPFAGGERYDLMEFASKEYTVIENKAQLVGAKGQYVLGLFKPDALETKPDEPTLAEMTKKALQLLSNGPNGFFLMVEGSQIDWANHGNDQKEFLRQMASFDNAVKAALEYARTRPDVLVVVTADHETGGMSLEGKPGKWKIKYSRDGHTSADTPLGAKGAGAFRFKGNNGFLDNTDIPSHIAAAMGFVFPQ